MKNKISVKKAVKKKPTKPHAVILPKKKENKVTVSGVIIDDTLL